MTAVTALVHRPRRCVKVCGRCKTPWKDGADRHMCADILRSKGYHVAMDLARQVTDSPDHVAEELFGEAAGLVPELGGEPRQLAAIILAFAFAQLDPVDHAVAVAVLRHGGAPDLADALAA